MTTTSIRASLCLLLPLLACAVEGSDETCISMRRLTSNALVPNKLSANGLLHHTLSSTALRTDALAFDPQELADPGVRDVFAYAVQCALDPQQSVEVTIDGVVHAFEGALGLAPEWGDAGGVCDDACRGWVSACLLARLNVDGERVVISLRGEHPGLMPSTEELAAFDAVEATYFGDVFAEPKRLHACLPDGQTGIPRVCGDDPSGCVVDLVGPCSAVCNQAGCRAADGTVFAEAITVQREPATAACQD